MKKIILSIFGFLLTESLFAQETSFRINQAGYFTSRDKIAVIINWHGEKDFTLVNKNTGDHVYKGEFSKEINSKNSSTTTRIADFSLYTKPGQYFLQTKDGSRSYDFIINDDYLNPVVTSAIKSYFFQRASIPLSAEYASKWKREKGHPDDSIVVHASAASPSRPEGTIIACPGGWYDAGDYNKYIVNSGISMATLLMAYDDFPKYFNTLSTSIPESANNLPDILDEILYNLRWMLTMQDPEDWGVYHKCTNAAFDKMIMPANATLPRYVVQKSTAAALNFAAVMAHSYRVFKAFENELPGLSDSCLHAAENAWRWAEKNPSVIYDQQLMNNIYEPDISTGEYGDSQLNDEWFWCASEMYLLNHDEKFLAAVKSKLPATFSVPSWNNTYALGFFSLLSDSGLDASLSGNIKKMVTSFADTMVASSGANAFKTIMGTSVSDFNWGSNSNALNQGMILIKAFNITGEKKYADGALSNMDYILGRNATGYSFVTGMGTKTPLYPHHRISIADGIDEPVPGLLVGGPNPGMQDKCHYDFFEPETAYSDTDCSYASNEVAINWNAPLVYVSGALDAIMNRKN